MAQLALIQNIVSSAPFDPSSYDLMVGNAEIPQAAHVLVAPLTKDGVSTSAILGFPAFQDWSQIQNNGWVKMDTQNGQTQVTPVQNLSSSEILGLVAPHQAMIGTYSAFDARFDPLAQILASAQIDAKNNAPALKPAGKRPNWTAAPVPHWAWIAAEEASADKDSVNLPEIAFHENYMRIGMVSFLQAVGPMNLTVETTTQLDIKRVLRHSYSMKRMGGVLRKQVRFDYIFPSDAAIRTELIPFLKQCRRAPFVPVMHSGLVHEHGITELAIQSVVVNTIPAQPEALSVEVIAYPFPGERYLVDGDLLDTAFNYPLLELWLTSDNRYHNLLNSTVQDQDPLTPTWNSQLVLATPSRDWLSLINENRTQEETSLIQKYSQADAAGNITDLAAVGAQAVGGDMNAYASLVSVDPVVNQAGNGDVPTDYGPNTGLNSADNPVLTTNAFRWTDPNTFLPHKDDGPFVIFAVTPSLAQYAFADPGKGGADFIVQHGVFDPYYGLQGQILTEQERTTERNAAGASTVSQVGQYYALWRVGGASNLQTDAFSPSQGIVDALAIDRLDPSKPEFDLPISLDNFTIETVSAGIANSLVEIAPSDAPTPEYQSIGGNDVSIEFTGVCKVDAVQQIYDALYEIAKLGVDFRGNQDGKPCGGYCRLDNEIAQMMGMAYAVPYKLVVETMPNFPTSRRVTLQFVQYDPDQRRMSLPADFSMSTSIPAADKANTSVSAVDDFLTRVQAYDQIDAVLSRIQLYDDIQPPSWDVLQKWVTDLKNDKIWNTDPTVDAPYPDYSFLTSWPYTGAWLAKNAGEFMGQPTPFPVDEMAPVGFSDPDFYCCARGDSSKLSGPKLVQNLLDSLYNDEHTVLYADTEGMTMGVKHGVSGVQVGPDARTYAVLSSHVDSAKGTSLSAGFTPNSARTLPVILGVPKSSRDSESSTSVPGGVSEPDPQMGMGVAKAATVMDTPDAFRKALGPNWDLSNPSSGYSQKAAAVIAAAQKLNVPLVVAANVLQTESNTPNLLDVSRDGADSRGPMQITAANFPSYFNKAVRLGYIDRSVHPDHNDLTQNTITGMLVLQEYYQHGAELLQNKGLSAAEFQYYSWMYAAASFNAGEGGAGLRTYLKHGGDPRQMEQNIRVKHTREDYVPNVFGRGPRVHTALITVDSFKPAGAGAAGAPAPAAPAPVTNRQGVGKTAVPLSPKEQYDKDLAAFQIANKDYQATKQAAMTRYHVTYDANGVAQNLPDGIESIFVPNIGPAPVPPVDPTASNDAGATAGQSYEDIHKTNWDYDRAVYDPENGEDIFYAMRKSNNTGRLLRAFPTACVLLVDGGRWLTFYHLVDTFYGLHAPMDITVFSSRESPADTCIISFADPYNNLSATTSDIELNKADSTQLTYDISSIFRGISASFKPNDDIEARRAQELKSILVKPGNRLHVRLGYGGDAAELPTVFNGTITGVEHNDDILTVTGLGDGQELVSQLSPAKGDGAFYQNIGANGGGQEIRNIILDILAAGTQETTARVSEGVFGATNPYGIEHFGDVRHLPLITDTSEIGINIYSGFSDQPINITVAAEDGPLGLVPEVTDLVGQWYDQLVDLTGKAFNKTSPEYLDGMGMNKMFRCLMGEELVGIRMENATPWGVVEALRRTCVDYVTSVEHFGLRSTLFFGKSWWPYHFQYNPAILDYTTAAQGQIQGVNAAYDVNANVEQYYRRRPMLQLHLCHSGLNLIASQIEATDEGWSRSVQAIGSYAGMIEPQTTETSLVQFMDTDIYPQFQNMKLVQSGMYSTRNMRLHEGLNNINPGEMLLLSTNVLNNYAVGALHDEVRQMYRGNVYMIGNGWVRPRHLMHVIDEMKQISGPAEVKCVEHTFSLDGGFVTTWQPDCVAYAHDTQMFALVAHALSYGSRAFAIDKALRLAYSLEGSAILRAGVASALRKLGNLDQSVGRGVGTGFRYAEYQGTRLTRNLFDRTDLGKFRIVASRKTAQRGDLFFSRRDVLNAVERSLGGKENFKTRRLRITQRLITQQDFDRILPKVQDDYARLQEATRGKTITTEERKILDEYVKRTVLKNQALARAPFEILKDGEAVADRLTQSNFKWLADKVSSQTGVRSLLTRLVKNEARANVLKSKISRPSAARGAYQAYAEFLKKVDPDAAALLRATLGKNGENAVQIADRISKEIPALEKTLADLKGKVSKGTKLTKQEASLLKDLEKKIPAQKALLAGLKDANKTAAVIAKGGAAAKTLEQAGKVGLAAGKGALKLGKIVAQIVIGAATSSFNRYLASRQALKVLPLQCCGKEMTAGIDGHLGLVVGDTLGPADAWMNAAFNTQQSNVAGKIAANVLNLLVGIGDVHYSDDDSSTYKQLVSAYGLPNAKTDRPVDVAARNRRYLTHLADLNNVGLLPNGLPNGSTLHDGELEASSAAGGVTYVSRTSTPVGQKYAKLVRDLAIFIGVSRTKYRQFLQQNAGNAAIQSKDNDLLSAHCAARIQRVMQSEGIDTSMYPRVGRAADLLSPHIGLTAAPFNKYWEKVSGPISVQEAARKYNGAILVWSGNRVHPPDGHVAIVFELDGRVYLLGNTSGNLALDVTNISGKLAVVDAVFLPR